MTIRLRVYIGNLKDAIVVGGCGECWMVGWVFGWVLEMGGWAWWGWLVGWVGWVVGVVGWWVDVVDGGCGECMVHKWVGWGMVGKWVG